MKKGYKHPVQSEYKPNLKSSHPGDRILAVRKPKAKGTVSKATRVKQEIGADSWQRLCEYVVNEGADKYIQTLEELDKKDFIVGFNAIIEYIKPKLIRSDNRNLNIDIKDTDITFM